MSNTQSNTNNSETGVAGTYSVVTTECIRDSNAYAGYSLDDPVEGHYGDIKAYAPSECDNGKQALFRTEMTKPLEVDVWGSSSSSNRYCGQYPRHGENVASPQYLPPVHMYLPIGCPIISSVCQFSSFIFPENGFVTVQVGDSSVMLRNKHTFLSYVDALMSTVVADHIDNFPIATSTMFQTARGAVHVFYNDLREGNPTTTSYVDTMGGWVLHYSDSPSTLDLSSETPTGNLIFIVVSEGDVILPSVMDFGTVSCAVFTRGRISGGVAPLANSPARFVSLASSYGGTFSSLGVPSETLFSSESGSPQLALSSIGGVFVSSSSSHAAYSKFVRTEGFDVSTDEGATWTDYLSSSAVEVRSWEKVSMENCHAEDMLEDQNRDMLGWLMKQQYGMDSYDVFMTDSCEAIQRAIEFFGDNPCNGGDDCKPHWESRFRNHTIKFMLGNLECYTHLIIEPEQGCESRHANWLIDTAPFVYENYMCRYFGCESAGMIETYRLNRDIFIPSQVQGYFMTLRDRQCLSEGHQELLGSRLDGVPLVVALTPCPTTLDKRDRVEDVCIPGCGSWLNPEDINTCIDEHTSGRVGGADPYYSTTEPDSDCDDNCDDHEPLECIGNERGSTIYSKYRRVDIMPPLRHADANLRCAYMTNTRYLPLGMRLVADQTMPDYTFSLDGMLVIRSKDEKRNNTVDVTLHYEAMCDFAHPEMNVGKFYEHIGDYPVVFFYTAQEACVVWHEKVYTLPVDTDVVIGCSTYRFVQILDGEGVAVNMALLSGGLPIADLPMPTCTETRCVRVRTTFGDMRSSERMTLAPVSDRCDTTVPEFLNFYRRKPNGMTMSNFPVQRLVAGEHIADVKLRSLEAQKLFTNNCWELDNETTGIAVRHQYLSRTVSCDDLEIVGVTELHVVDGVAYTKLFPGTRGSCVEESDYTTLCGETPHFSIGEHGEVSEERIPFRAAGQLFIRDTSVRVPASRTVVTVPYDQDCDGNVTCPMPLTVEDRRALKDNHHFTVICDGDNYIIKRRTRTNPIIITESVIIQGVVECPRVNSVLSQTGRTCASCDSVINSDGTVLTSDLPMVVDNVCYIPSSPPYIEVTGVVGASSVNPEVIERVYTVEEFNTEVSPQIISVRRPDGVNYPEGVTEVFVDGKRRFTITITIGTVTITITITCRLRDGTWKTFTVDAQGPVV